MKFCSAVMSTDFWHPSSHHAPMLASITHRVASLLSLIPDSTAAACHSCNQAWHMVHVASNMCARSNEVGAFLFYASAWAFWCISVFWLILKDPPYVIDCRKSATDTASRLPYAKSGWQVENYNKITSSNLQPYTDSDTARQMSTPFLVQCANKHE